MKKIAIAALLSAFMTGCAFVSTTYGPDGREVLTLNCSGLARSWNMCLSAAGDRCGSAGYDILSQNGESGYVSSAYGSASGSYTQRYGSYSGSAGGFGGSTITRTMVVSCRAR